MFTDTVRKARLGLALKKAQLTKDEIAPAAPAASTPNAPAAGEEALSPPTPARVTDFGGIQIAIERPAGFVQKGVAPDGKEWQRVYHVDYGYVPNTKGGDSDALDVYIGKGAPEMCQKAHWIAQVKEDGSFDEWKVFLGFISPESAKGMYLAHTPKKNFGWQAETSIGMIRALLGLDPVEVGKAVAGFAVEHGESTPLSSGVVDKLIRKGLDARLLPVAKAEELSYALGVVLEPDVVDAQGDTYDAETIREAAWRYLAAYRNVGLNHKGLINLGAAVVESYIAPVDMTIEGQAVKAGTWLLGIKFFDTTIWGDVKSGKLSGLSIGGFAEKTPIK